MPPREQLEHLYDTDSSIVSFLISASRTASALAFVAVTPLYGLAACNVFGVEHFPERIQQPIGESGLPVLVRLIYLVGPLIGIVSVGIFLFMARLERILRLRALARRAEDPATKASIREIVSLMQKRHHLGDQVTNWDLDDPAYQAYREAAFEHDRKKRQLLGATPASHLTHFVLVSFNWYALGVQVYYGVRWGFSSKWLALPILAIWFGAVLACTISLIRGDGDDHKETRG